MPHRVFVLHERFDLRTCRLGLRLFGCDFGEDGLGGQHAALHGRVGAFDFGHVHETGAAADQQPSRESQLW